MLSFEESQALYAKYHTDRINKEIAESDDERYINILKAKDIPYFQNPDTYRKFYNYLIDSGDNTHNAKSLIAWDLSLNKILWKTIAQTCGKPMPKNESERDQLIRYICSDAAFDNAKAQLRREREERIAKRKIEEHQKKIKAIELTGTQTITIDKQPTTIAQFTAEYYAAGWRVIKKKTSIAYTYQLCNPTTGSYFPNPRRKRGIRYYHNTWKDSVIPYFLHYQQQQEQKSTTPPSLTERFPYKKFQAAA